MKKKMHANESHKQITRKRGSQAGGTGRPGASGLLRQNRGDPELDPHLHVPKDCTRVNAAIKFNTKNHMLCIQMKDEKDEQHQFLKF